MEQSHGEQVNEAIGKQIGGKFSLLKSPHPFVVFLHGIASDASTWIMTDVDLKSLFVSPGYTEFLTACFASRTVLFVGMSADDVSAGGHLMNLTGKGIDAGEHFWVTDRSDAATDSWAENAGIRTICYKAPGNDHSELIEFLDNILSYLPQEQFAPPVALSSPATTGPSALPPPGELVSHPDEEHIRAVLNAEATRILSDSTQAAYAEFEAFSKTYDRAIWRAWYVTSEPPSNKLLGFTLESEVAKGAFGTVYRATKPGVAGNLAIKVLHHGIRNDPQLLQSFRRGVRSMEILSTSDVQGMIPYREASEIPAFAVMEYIDGPNLAQAVKAGDVKMWNTVLAISCELARIIKAAHELPERVLHRDVRPANIMLRNFHRHATEYQVLVLDFDLSWHRGASELSVMSPQAVSGYLAPEQVNRDPKVSTRHAAVDSFGLGMTLYFLRSGVEPVFSHHKHTDWIETLKVNIASVKCSNWKSLPARFARLIEASTRERQADRWDMSQILSELQRLREAEASPSFVESAELFAEEIAWRGGLQDYYKWSADRNEVVADYHGVKYTLRGHESTGQVEIELRWRSKQGAKVERYMKTSAGKALSELKRAGWTTPPKVEVTDDGVRITARVYVTRLQRYLDDAVSGVTKAFSAFDVH